MFLVLASYKTYQRVVVRKAHTDTEMQPAVIAFVALFGVFLLFASVPGAFLEQPHRSTNKLYWVVEKAIEAFT